MSRRDRLGGWGVGSTGSSPEDVRAYGVSDFGDASTHLASCPLVMSPLQSMAHRCCAVSMHIVTPDVGDRKDASNITRDA